MDFKLPKANSRFKKLSCITIVFICLFTTIFSIPVIAASKMNIRVDSPAVVSPGQTVSVPVYLNNNPGVAVMVLDIVYDRNVMTLKNIKNGNALKGESSNIDGGVLFWMDMSGKNMYNNGLLVTLEFYVNSYAANGVYDIDLHYDEGYIANESIVSLYPKIYKGQISVGERPTISSDYNYNVVTKQEFYVPITISSKSSLTEAYEMLEVEGTIPQGFEASIISGAIPAKYCSVNNETGYFVILYDAGYNPPQRFRNGETLVTLKLKAPAETGVYTLNFETDNCIGVYNNYNSHVYFRCRNINFNVSWGITNGNLDEMGQMITAELNDLLSSISLCNDTVNGPTAEINGKIFNPIKIPAKGLLNLNWLPKNITVDLEKKSIHIIIGKLNSSGNASVIKTTKTCDSSWSKQYQEIKDMYTSLSGNNKMNENSWQRFERMKATG